MMEISSDSIIIFEIGHFAVNATIFFTWLIMIFLVVGAWLTTRKLSSGSTMSFGQNMMEALVGGVCSQIREACRQDPRPYLPFIASLFIFIAISNTLSIIPGFYPPTASLSTTTALALCVFISVPYFGISRHGVKGYLKQYIQPSIFMLPFNIMGELSRTLALAVRLFGNAMSGEKTVAILLLIVPFVFPVLMQILGLLTGLIQAYIFAILALVYIASASEAHEEIADKDRPLSVSTPQKGEHLHG